MDDVDITEERARLALEADVMKVRKAAASMPAGKPGECERCGEWSGRLVRGACAPCRDRFNLD